MRTPPPKCWIILAIVNWIIAQINMTFVTLQRRDLIVSQQITDFENLDVNIQIKFGIFVFNELENYDEVNSSTYMVRDIWFVKHN